ncbi:MAG: hydrogenase maturation nickel metallochaperone HypA [Spirochaetes bacterium]|nr:hydrogenase maturation nickel metallochaperone HypA [Spirochaetota bacterium]
MHELGIVYEVIKVVDGYVCEHGLSRVEKIVLEIGQLSQAIPRFIEECYPAAISGTRYEETRLEIIVVPAEGRCKQCAEIFNVVEQRRVCPKCQSADFCLVSGQEFEIKEIVAC